MNTLQDLRATLDQHAAEVGDDLTSARVAAVHGRARVVRRRRAAGVGAAAVLAVVVATAVALGPRPAPGPAAAPESLTALGWRYQLDDTASSGSDRVVLELPASDLPRLVSWSTRGPDQAVVVRWSDRRAASEVADYGDFVQVPRGFEGAVSVSGPEGLALASYVVDASVSPEGVGDGLTTFREDVAGIDLLGAAAGEAGQASVAVDLRPGRGMVWLGYYCEGLPAGARMHVGWVGERGDLVFGGCDSGDSFDPGGSVGIGLPPGRWADEDATLRLWVTRDGRPVEDGEVPGLRLGLGAYTDSSPPTVVAGIGLRDRIEHEGHVWALVDVAVGGAGEVPRIETPADGTFLVTEAVRGRGTVRYAITVDGRRAEGDTIFAGGGGGGGDRVSIAPGSVASLRFGTPRDRVTEAGLGLYRRVD